MYNLSYVAQGIEVVPTQVLRRPIKTDQESEDHPVLRYRLVKAARHTYDEVWFGVLRRAVIERIRSLSQCVELATEFQH